MKCELAAALLHRPTTLFLDEPTIGLDVAMQVAIRDFVRSYNQRHEATVLLTSHYMDDVVALCPRIIVIDQGKLIHDGDLRGLVKTDGSRQARVVHAARRRRRRRAREARHGARDGGAADHAARAERELAGVVGHLLGKLQGRRPRDRGSAARGHPARDVRQARTRRRRSSLSRTLRALPTLLRIGVAETVAYRAEFLVWILTTTLPLIMLGLWTSVAREAAVPAATTSATFVAYFLATLIVRQLTGNWVAWQMMRGDPHGHDGDAPVAARSIRSSRTRRATLAAMPFRSVDRAAARVIAAARGSGASALTHDPLQLALSCRVDRDGVADHVRDHVRDRRARVLHDPDDGDLRPVLRAVLAAVAAT